MYPKFVLRYLKSWIQSETIAELFDVKQIERKCNQKSEGLVFNSLSTKNDQALSLAKLFYQF